MAKESCHDLFFQKFFHLPDEGGKHSVGTTLGFLSYRCNNRALLKEVAEEFVLSYPKHKFEEVILEAEYSYHSNKHAHFQAIERNGSINKGLLSVRLNNDIFMFSVSTDMRSNDKTFYKIQSLNFPENGYTISLTENCFGSLFTSLVLKEYQCTYAPISAKPEVPKEPELKIPQGDTDWPWIQAENLVPFAAALQKKISENPSGFLDQTHELGCQTKYITITVDQRIGNFTVSGRTDPKLIVQHSYPQHFYPQGWTVDDKMNTFILNMVLDLNSLVNMKVTKQQVRLQAANLETSLKEAFSRYAFDLVMNQSILPHDLMKYYGPK